MSLYAAVLRDVLWVTTLIIIIIIIIIIDYGDYDYDYDYDYDKEKSEQAACTLHSTVCMTCCGLRAAFLWLCKSETTENHVLYHAPVVSRCTS